MSAALRDAAEGRLPDWAQVDQPRIEHIARVAALLDEWAIGLGLSEAERGRWRAAAWLHDALRLAPAAELRPLVPFELRELAPPLLHGPAAAAMLRSEGVTDEGLLLAVGYHTLGHPELDAMGRALYAADFLEPGRTFDPLVRATLRARMPASMDSVVPAICRARIVYLLRTGRSVRPETMDFWNVISQHVRT